MLPHWSKTRKEKEEKLEAVINNVQDLAFPPESTPHRSDSGYFHIICNLQGRPAVAPALLWSTKILR